MIYVDTVLTIKSTILERQYEAKDSSKLNMGDWIFSTAFPFLHPCVSLATHNCELTLHANIYEILLVGHDIRGALCLVFNPLFFLERSR